MVNSKEALNHKKVGDVDNTASLVESGLDKKTTKMMYKRFKNEGKCCEGGSEGWTG